MPEYIYVNANSGSDTTGDGSIEKPYKTLHHFMLNVAVKNGASYEVLLSEGEYAFSAATFQSFQSSKITIIGQGMKTALVQSTGIASNSGGVGYNTTTIEFCRLIYKTTFTTPTINCNCFRWNWIMRNVAFIDIPDDRGASYATLGFMYPVSSKLELYNCIKHKPTVGFLRTTEGTIKVYDSAGPFKSGYSTVDAHWNMSGNLIKELSFTDDYEVISGEHLGLYTGEYSWSMNRSFILHDGIYKKAENILLPRANNLIERLVFNGSNEFKGEKGTIFSSPISPNQIMDSKEGYVSDFNGSNQYLRSMTNNLFPIGDKVIKFKMKSSLKKIQIIMSTSESAQRGWFIGISDTGELHYAVNITGASSWQMSAQYGKTMICDNEWHELTLEYKDGQYIKWYVDGVLDYHLSHNYKESTTATNNLVIGRRSSPTGVSSTNPFYFNGQFTGLEIYKGNLEEMTLWAKVSENLPDKTQFMEEGMESLFPLLNRVTKEFNSIQMNKKE